MKIKEGFMLREIAGSWIVVPIDTRIVEFNGIMTLSESGALLWKRLENDAELDDLAKTLTAEYNVQYDAALSDAKEFVEGIREKGLIDQ